jgi:hypothetical protein
LRSIFTVKCAAFVQQRPLVQAHFSDGRRNKVSYQKKALVKYFKLILLKTAIIGHTGWSKNLRTLDDYSTRNTQKYFKQFQSLTMIT